MTNKHAPKLIILGFVLVTAVMMSHTLYTSDVFDEEIKPNNYIVDLQDSLSMKSGIGISMGTHIVLEDVLRMDDKIDVLKMEDNING